MSHSRKTFEQAFLNQYTDFERFENGEYMDDFLQHSWLGWQASRQALEGEVVAYKYWWKVSPRIEAVCKLEHLPTSGDDLIVIPLYTHPTSGGVPEGWKLVPILSTESMELAARDWGTPNITPNEAGEVWDAMVEVIPEPPKITDAVASVPKGWTIEPFDDGFGVNGISVLWPGDRGGAHLRPNDPENSIAQNLLYDLAEALLCGSKPDECPSLGQRKAAQIGPVIGVLVQNQDGEVAAVTDMGRCTWLNQNVTGAGDGESVPDAEYIRVLQDACDIIQADANTEQNYGSLCRIGNVLAKLRAAPTNADVWIKCSDRLPSDTDGKMLWTHDAARGTVELTSWAWAQGLFKNNYITHWMPTGLDRPAPPKQEQDDGRDH